MIHRKKIYSTCSLLLTLSFILVGIIYSAQNDQAKVHFLDVGQGDAILITQGQKQILIDGGPSQEIILEKVGQYMPFWDRKIDVLINTHPDKDHLEGLLAMLEYYQVGMIIDSGVAAQSETYKKYIRLIEENQVSRMSGARDTVVRLSAENFLTIVSASADEENSGDAVDTNDLSVVTRLAVGQDSFLLTGDISSTQEASLIHQSGGLVSRIVKVAHHGSKNSTSADFLNSVKPVTAIISVGKENRYGHPNGEVLSRLKDRDIQTLRTDEKGDIIYKCDKGGLCATLSE